MRPLASSKLWPLAISEYRQDAYWVCDRGLEMLVVDLARKSVEPQSIAFGEVVSSDTKASGPETIDRSAQPAQTYFYELPSHGSRQAASGKLLPNLMIGFGLLSPSLTPPTKLRCGCGRAGGIVVHQFRWQT